MREASRQDSHHSFSTLNKQTSRTDSSQQKISRSDSLPVLNNGNSGSSANKILPTNDNDSQKMRLGKSSKEGLSFPSSSSVGLLGMASDLVIPGLDIPSQEKNSPFKSDDKKVSSNPQSTKSQNLPGGSQNQLSKLKSLAKGTHNPVDIAELGRVLNIPINNSTTQLLENLARQLLMAQSLPLGGGKGKGSQSASSGNTSFNDKSAPTGADRNTGIKAALAQLLSQQGCKVSMGGVTFASAPKSEATISSTQTGTSVQVEGWSSASASEVRRGETYSRHSDSRSEREHMGTKSSKSMLQGNNIPSRGDVKSGVTRGEIYERR